MTFGEKLKEARKKAGLSQEQFAEKMCVSRSAIAKWETDKGMPERFEFGKYLFKKAMYRLV